MSTTPPRVVGISGNSINLKDLNKEIILSREGDDIYWEGKKLSISVATKSPTSTLIHFAVNISNEGTPVPTCSLQDFKIAPEIFSKRVMEALCTEVQGMIEATQKVHWVR